MERNHTEQIFTTAELKRDKKDQKSSCASQPDSTLVSPGTNPKKRKAIEPLFKRDEHSPDSTHRDGAPRRSTRDRKPRKWIKKLGP